MNLSCIIVNYNSSSPLQSCLESIYKTIHDLDFEVIVIDNSEDDPGMKAVKASFSQVQYINTAEI